MSKPIGFVEFSEKQFIPDDIKLIIPNDTSVSDDKLHFLISIPWEDIMIKSVPRDYQQLFSLVLPYLHVRTTDVHTAYCLRFISTLIKVINKPVSEKVIYTAFILHDSGWSRMTDIEIASSLGVKGIATKDGAIAPKEKHASLSVEIAKQVLNQDIGFTLSSAERQLILDTILYHDKPGEINGGDVPVETKIVCDADHLWSFTHENFWQDTVRKGITPLDYLENIKKDLEGYFTTEEGKTLARQMLEEREQEVFQYPSNV